LYADLNQDNHVNSSDVDELEAALADESAYRSTYGLTHEQVLLIGDLNGDGVFANDDIQVMLYLLLNGGGY
jgi:hypothetical protein